MQFLRSVLPALLVAGVGVASAASAWTFEDATIAVSAKAGAGFKDKLSSSSPLKKDVTLSAADNLKIILTATEGGKAKRPHQAFLVLKEQGSGLETTFPLSVKESGKAKVDLSQKDLPVQFLTSTEPLQATLLLGSFGASSPLSAHVFNLDVALDPAAPAPSSEKTLRYGKLENIDHIFKADAKSGPKIISLFFVLAILATIPVLFGTWGFIGANLDHLSKSISAAPIAHSTFFGSILAMEGLFFLYYSSWSLFKVLPVAGVIGLSIFLSGSKALSEVQSRRLTGDR